MPYSTCESAFSSVVQVIVAPEDVMLPDVTLEITGGVVSPSFLIVMDLVAVNSLYVAIRVNV